MSTSSPETDPLTVARRARASLANARDTIQSAVDVTAAALDVTITLTQAVAALDSLERSGGAQIAPHAATALGRARESLAALGPHEISASVRKATVAIASAIEALVELCAMKPLVHPATAAVVAPAPAPGPHPAVSDVRAAVAVGPQGTVEQAPLASAFADLGQAPLPPIVPGTVPMGPGVVVDVFLDATSDSNFYIRPSGSDVVQHGGLFVSAASPPSAGTPVHLRVTVEEAGSFEVLGVARWSRSKTPNAAAGFGASLVEISPEARARIQAYVSTRAPFSYG